MPYRVFVRNWWKRTTIPGGGSNLEPDLRARKRVIFGRVQTEKEAQEICRAYNSTHAPGPLSRKAEYEEL